MLLSLYIAIFVTAVGASPTEELEKGISTAVNETSGDARAGGPGDFSSSEDEDAFGRLLRTVEEAEAAAAFGQRPSNSSARRPPAPASASASLIEESTRRLTLVEASVNAALRSVRLLEELAARRPHPEDADLSPPNSKVQPQLGRPQQPPQPA